MKKITKPMYDAYRRGVEAAVARSSHNLTTRVVPVNLVLAKEIGMKIDPEKLEQAKHVKAGTSVSVLLNLVDYAEAMEAYGAEHYGYGEIDPEPKVSLGNPIEEPTEAPSNEESN